MFRCLKLFQHFTIFWFTTLSNSLSFLQVDNLFSLLYKYLFFFWYKCVVFAIRGILLLMVQEYQEIKTCITLGNNDFGWWMMAICRWISHKCPIFQAVWKWNLVFFPSWWQYFISLSINLYSNFTMSYKCTWKVLEEIVKLI